MKSLDPRLKNVLWMGIEKGISFIGVFVITATMARYIGPHYYGVISYSVSMFSLLYVFSAMGADPIIIKKGSVNIAAGKLRSLFLTLVRTLIYLFLSFLFYIYLYFFNHINEPTTFILVGAVFISQLILSLDYISIVNNYSLRSKVNTVSNITGLIVALILRYMFVKYKLPVEYFSIPIILSPIIAFFIKFFSFKHEGVFKNISGFFRLRIVFLTAKVLMPFAISSIAANVYNRMPLILITSVLGYSLSGVYSCALSLSTAWSFFPNSLISSFIPKYYNDKDNVYLSKIILLVSVLCASISISIYFLSPYIVFYLFGTDYLGAIKIIPLILISTTLSMIGNALYHYFIQARGYSFVMKKTIACAFLSIVSGYFFIKYFGLYGAALSLVIIEFSSLVLFNLFYKKGEPISILKHSFTPACFKSLRHI